MKKKWTKEKSTLLLPRGAIHASRKRRGAAAEEAPAASRGTPPPRDIPVLPSVRGEKEYKGEEHMEARSRIKRLVRSSIGRLNFKEGRRDPG